MQVNSSLWKKIDGVFLWIVALIVEKK